MIRFVGVDGGATRSLAAVMDEGGVVVGRAEGGPGIVASGDPVAGVPALLDLARRALESAETPAGAGADAVCFALAGAGRAAERSAVREALDASGLAPVVRVVTDAEAALFDAFGGGPGLLLIAGTGSVAWGRRTAASGTVRVGGWGARVGDEGSAHAIGLAALRAVARASDGRGPATSLKRPVLAAAGAGSEEELIRWADAAGKSGIAALARAVADAAEAGDAVADGILEDAAAALVEHVRALLERTGPWRRPAVLALAGGLLGRGRPLRDRVKRRLRGESDIAVAVLEREVDAARGAAGLAREAAGLRTG